MILSLFLLVAGSVVLGLAAQVALAAARLVA